MWVCCRWRRGQCPGMSYKLASPPSRSPQFGQRDRRMDVEMNGQKAGVRMGKVLSECEVQDEQTKPEDKRAAWDCGCVRAGEEQRRPMMKIHGVFSLLSISTKMHRHH